MPAGETGSIPGVESRSEGPDLFQGRAGQKTQAGRTGLRGRGEQLVMEFLHVYLLVRVVTSAATAPLGGDPRFQTILELLPSLVDKRTAPAFTLVATFMLVTFFRVPVSLRRPRGWLRP